MNLYHNRKQTIPTPLSRIDIVSNLANVGIKWHKRQYAPGCTRIQVPNVQVVLEDALETARSILERIGEDIRAFIYMLKLSISSEVEARIYREEFLRPLGRVIPMITAGNEYLLDHPPLADVRNSSEDEDESSSEKDQGSDDENGSERDNDQMDLYSSDE
ncbi:hypothetical protein DFQ29_004237 [Apophysomyces sp. BC1021]|nr:hypothetical protein DFQ29_004237 [Apophysomyces sp. BC1021]